MIGEKLSDRYEILREIGRGGMGVVYLAQDPLLGREVAIKLLPPTLFTPETEERFKREARVVAGMDHPSIVAVHDIGTHAGALFFVMPFVRGASLRALIRERSLRLGEMIDVAVQVAEALEYSHAQGVIHRDIKPENILVEREPPDLIRARVTDFGLAMALTEDRLTRTGALVGTATYFSPEQVTTEEIDGRTDIYSLGTVLYECALGDAPFTGSVPAVLYSIVNEVPLSPRARGATIPAELDDLIMQCLEKSRWKRPQRAGDIADALLRVRAQIREEESAAPIGHGPGATPHHRARSAPLIGRASEIAVLQRRINLALSGECQFVLVAGEAGTGKSRLLEEAEKLAVSHHVHVLHGRFVERDRAFPYQGFCEAIQDYYRQKSGGSWSASADFSDLAPELSALFPALAEIGEIRISSTGTPPHLTPAEVERPADRIAVFELIARTLTRIAGGQPLALLLEDLHAGDVSVEALQYVVRRLGPTPTFVAATYRTSDVQRGHPLISLIESFHGDRRFTLIRVEPFSHVEHRAFIEAMLGGSNVEPSLVDRIYEASEGNPYFTIELVRTLSDAGGIVKGESGTWRLLSDSAIPVLPPTILQTVEKRVERLPEDLREILAIASVIGKTFEFEDLLALSETKEPQLESAIEHLTKAGFIQEEAGSRGDRMMYSSGVVRDVLYAGMSRRKRRWLHRKYAEEIERKNARRLERFYPLLVHHYAQGDVPEKVIEYGMKQARKHMAAFGSENAVRAVRTVLEFLDEGEAGHEQIGADARAILSAALRLEGDFDGSLRASASVIDFLEKGPDTRALANALVTAAETAWDGRRIDEARKWVERGLAVARALRDAPILVRLLSLGSTVATLRGEYARAHAFMEEAEEHRPRAREETSEHAHAGGRLVVAMTVSAQATHPADIRLDEEAEILSNVFETLVQSDARGNLLPLLADRWEPIGSGSSFVFHLRQGARWHDGSPITAACVKASIESSARRSRHGLAPAHAAISGMDVFLDGAAPEVAGLIVRDEATLEVCLVEPLPIFPALLTHVRTGIARDDAGTSHGGGAMATGPFRLQSAQPERITIERQTGYWRGKDALLDAVVFRSGLSSGDIARGLRSGEIDLARDVRPGDMEEILRDSHAAAGATVVDTLKKNIYLVVFNTNSPAVRSPDVRRALRHVVRTQDLVRATMGRFAEPAEGLLPPGFLGHDPARRHHSMSVDEAAELLGRPRTPFRLRAAVHPILRDRYAAVTEELFRAWAEIGVHVEVATTDIDDFIARETANEGIDLLLGRHVADYDDPDNFCYQLFHSSFGRYGRYYSFPALDELIERARAETWLGEREKLYRKIENVLLEDDVILPLFHEIDCRVASSRIRGLAMRSTPPYVNYAEIGKVESAISTSDRSAGGGTITVPLTGEILTLDPARVRTLEEYEACQTVFETLTQEGEGARVVPWLADEIQMEADGRVFHFRLREGVRFHDGSRLTSRDVRHSFERILLDPESDARWLLSPIIGADALLSGESRELTGLQILSEREFTVRLREPLTFFPALVTHYPAMTPAGTEHPGSSWREGCVGTGPFRVVRHEPGRRLVLEANPDYWRPGLPKCEGLSFTSRVPPNEILEGFRAGRYSLAWNLAPADVSALRRDAEYARCFRESPSLSTHLVALNIHDGPLAEEPLRHRFREAVDVPLIVRRTLGRLATPARSLIPPGLLGHEPPLGAPTRAAPNRSDPGGIPLVGMVHSLYEGPYAGLAADLFDALRAAGFSIKILEQHPETPGGRDTSADFVLVRWMADYADADSFVHGLLHTQQGYQGHRCGLREVDELSERARAESDPDARHRMYRQVEQIIADRALLLPLFHEQICRFARPEVMDFELSFPGPHVIYENLWIRR